MDSNLLKKLLKLNSKHQMDVNLQKKCPTTNLFQSNTKLFQNSLSEPTALTCHKKYCLKRIPNIEKYSAQSPLLPKLQANSRSIQHLIYSKRNCCKTLRTFSEAFSKAFSRRSPRQSLKRTLRDFSKAFPVPRFNVLLSLKMFCWQHSAANIWHTNIK